MFLSHYCKRQNIHSACSACSSLGFWCVGDEDFIDTCWLSMPVSAFVFTLEQITADNGRAMESPSAANEWQVYLSSMSLDWGRGWSTWRCRCGERANTAQTGPASSLAQDLLAVRLWDRIARVTQETRQGKRHVGNVQLCLFTKTENDIKPYCHIIFFYWLNATVEFRYIDTFHHKVFHLVDLNVYKCMERHPQFCFSWLPPIFQPSKYWVMCSASLQQSRSLYKGISQGIFWGSPGRVGKKGIFKAFWHLFQGEHGWERWWWWQRGRWKFGLIRFF